MTTATDVYADLYSALFWASVEPDRYARRSSPGQLSLFGDEPADEPQEPPDLSHRFGKGAGEPLFTEPSRQEGGDWTWSTTGFQGTGRPEQASVYKHGPGSVFRDADYFAFTPEHARLYGPEVQEHEVRLKNPRHITNDLDWKTLTEEAGVNGKLGLGTMNPEVIRREADKLSQHLRDKGHDGLVLTGLPKTRAAQQIFGHDQVVKFRPAADQPPTPTEDEAATRPDRDGYMVVDGKRRHIEDLVRGAREAYQDTLATRGPEHRITKLAKASLQADEQLLAQHRATAPRSREMIPRLATTPASNPGPAFPPNHVIAEVRDQQGQVLGHEMEPHEGTPDSIREANGRLRARLDDLHPTWSNVMTRTGATNQQARPQWVVSPNSRNVYESGTPEAQDLMGLTSSPDPTPGAITQQPTQEQLDQHPEVVAAKAALDRIQAKMGKMNRQGQTGTRDPVRLRQWQKAHAAYLRAVEDAKRQPLDQTSRVATIQEQPSRITRG